MGASHGHRLHYFAAAPRVLGTILSKPSAGLSSFMLGRYRALASGSPWFTTVMVHVLGTIILFGSVAQQYPWDAQAHITHSAHNTPKPQG